MTINTSVVKNRLYRREKKSIGKLYRTFILTYETNYDACKTNGRINPMFLGGLLYLEENVDPNKN